MDKQRKSQQPEAKKKSRRKPEAFKAADDPNYETLDGINDVRSSACLPYELRVWF